MGRRTSRPPQLQLSARTATVKATKGDPAGDVTAQRNIYLAEEDRGSPTSSSGGLTKSSTAVKRGLFCGTCKNELARFDRENDAWVFRKRDYTVFVSGTF